MLVSLFESLKVVQLAHEVVHLGLEGVDLVLCIGQRLLFSLQVITLLVYKSVKLFDFIEGLGDFKLKTSNLIL